MSSFQHNVAFQEIITNSCVTVGHAGGLFWGHHQHWHCTVHPMTTIAVNSVQQISCFWKLNIIYILNDITHWALTILVKAEWLTQQNLSQITEGGPKINYCDLSVLTFVSQLSETDSQKTVRDCSYPQMSTFENHLKIVF